MPKASPGLTSFNGGIVSELFEGRTDLANYNASCTVLENFIPLIQGPALKRPGTLFVNEVKDSTKKVRLIPFQFNIEQAYVLEFGDQYIRFYSNGALIESGGSPVEVVSPYLEAELFEIQYAQTGDLLYIVHENHPPQLLSRTGVDQFSLDEIEFSWPAFLDENADVNQAVTFGPGGVGDTITFTSFLDVFNADQVGGYIKTRFIPEARLDEWKASTAYAVNDAVHFAGNVYVATSAATSGTRPPVHLVGTESDGGVNWEYFNSGEGYAQIVSYISPTQITATIIVPLNPGISNISINFALSAWSEDQGYPRSIAFYENRLIFGGSKGKPQTIWGSVTDIYNDFRQGTEDDDSFAYTINSNQVNTIQWLSSSRVLAIGTAGGEFIATGENINAAITPTSISITRQTSFGSSHAIPPMIGPDILFTQRSKRKVREYRFEFQIQSYVASDLTVFADDVLEGNVVEAHYQQEPSRIVWYVMEDGHLIGLTFERQQSVVGWHCHLVGGTDAKVESVAVIPHPDEDVDQLWLAISRTINGQTKRYIERMEKLFDGYSEPVSTAFMDSAIKYSGAATSTITGLDHLEGESVVVVADGALIKPDRTVTSGQITLDDEYTSVIAGLPYTARLQTMPIEAGAADGISQGKTGRIHNLTIRVKSAGSGLFYGSDFDNMSEVSLRKTTDLMDNPVPLVTGYIGPQIMPNGYEKPNRIAIKHDAPLPFTLVALYPQLNKQDR